jgi:hypothetical protein
MSLKKASLMLAFSFGAHLSDLHSPGSFFIRAIRGAHLSGQHATLLKTAPGSFFVLE